MNRVALVVVMVALCLCGAVGDLDARIINLRESLHLAAGDTISAQTVMDSIKAATREDVLVCDSLVVRGGISFADAWTDTVRCNLSFRGTTFEGKTSAWRATFQGKTNFKEATFQGMVLFVGVRFQGGASFVEATFQGSVDFGEAAFQGNAFFGGAMFEQDAYFWIATFYGLTTFDEATFQGKVYFNGATFEGYANFGRATFERKASFGSAMFQEEAYFGGARFQSRTSFGMVVASRPISITWPQLNGHVFYSRPNYFFLLHNFQQLGYTDDYDDCYYDFRVQARKHERRWHSPIRWAEWVFLDLTCGYGVKPFRAIIWAAAVIVLFAFGYYQLGAIQERRIEAHTHEGPRGYTLLGTTADSRTRLQRLRDALYFSVNTFTTVGYGDWYPTAERLKVRLWRWTITIPVLRFRTLAMMEGLIGWLLLALFLVTLGKKWIR